MFHQRFTQKDQYAFAGHAEFFMVDSGGRFAAHDGGWIAIAAVGTVLDDPVDQVVGYVFVRPKVDVFFGG